MSLHLSVDLKWCLLSRDTGHWEEYAPGVLRKLRDAFAGRRGPVTFYTAPRKEIRFGTVTVWQGRATVNLHTEWDDVREGLISECLTGEEAHDAEQERHALAFFSHGFGANGEPFGAVVSQSLTAKTFPQLLEKLDAAENLLLSEDANNWRAFQEWMKP